MKTPIKDGDRVYATGVFLTRTGKTWGVVSFEDDAYFNGAYVEDIEGKPYIEFDALTCQTCRKLGQTICPGKIGDCYEGRR